MVEEARGEACEGNRPVAGRVGVDYRLLAHAQVSGDVGEVLAVVDDRDGDRAAVGAHIAGRLRQIGCSKKGGSVLGASKADEHSLGCRDQLNLTLSRVLLQVPVQV